MTKWGIHSIFDVVGTKCVQTYIEPYGYVRAVRVPYSGNRIGAAWAVLTGKAYAIEWPKHGDLEEALSR